MSTVAPEVDLVNAALLGTDRRDVPAPDGTDPAGWLLEAAGRRRAVSLVAGATTVVRVPAPGPPAVRVAPAAAREILDELVLQASTTVLDLWLREAVAAGCGLAPEHWTPVLERARRSTELDRRRLGAALGPRGLWFARHNPAWAAVVRAAEAPAAGVVAEVAAEVAPSDDLARLARDPDRLLTRPDPWSADVARVAVGVLAAGIVPVRSARSLGQRIGARLPLGTYAALTSSPPTGLEPSATAAARAGLAGAEEVLWARWTLAQAFDPARQPPERRPVSSVPTLQERR